MGGTRLSPVRVWLIGMLVVWAAGMAGCSLMPRGARDDPRQAQLRRRFQRAWFLTVQGETKTAAADLEGIYEEMLLEDEIADDVIFWLGYCLEENKEYAAAIEKYDELAVLYPESKYAPEATAKAAELRKRGRVNSDF